MISSVTLFTGLWSCDYFSVVRSKILPNGYLDTQAKCMVAGWFQVYNLKTLFGIRALT